MQTRLSSFCESVVNTAVGLIFSYTIQITLNHFYNIEMSNSVAIQFVFWFTIASVIRQYIIRRVYNRITQRGRRNEKFKQFNQS